jgi:hypothetical protein
MERWGDGRLVGGMDGSRFLAAFGMTARKARAKAKANTGVLRCAQDDDEKQATAKSKAN